MKWTSNEEKEEKKKRPKENINGNKACDAQTHITEWPKVKSFEYLCSYFPEVGNTVAVYGYYQWK